MKNAVQQFVAERVAAGHSDEFDLVVLVDCLAAHLAEISEKTEADGPDYAGAAADVTVRDQLRAAIAP